MTSSSSTTASIKIRQAVESDIVAIANLSCKSFLSKNPVIDALGVPFETVHFLHTRVAKACVGDSLSYVATAQSTDEILAVVWIHDFTTPFPPMSAEDMQKISPKQAPLRKLFGAAGSAYDEVHKGEGKVKRGEVAFLPIVACDPAHIRTGICTRLVSSALDNLRSLGYKRLVLDAVNPGSQALFTKFGGKVYFQKEYAEIEEFAKLKGEAFRSFEISFQ